MTIRIFRFTLIIFLACELFHSCKNENEKVKPVMGSITESVYASVTIQPEDFYDAYAAVTGIVETVFVKEGDTVLKNQLIATIKADNQLINVENAKLNLEKSREDYRGEDALLRSLQDEMSILKKQVKIDSINYIRQKQLWQKNIGSKSDYENQQLRYELTQNNLKLLRKKYAQTRLDLKNKYVQSVNLLKKAKYSYSDFEIRSRINGTVYAILKKEGELILPQEALAQIGNTFAFIIEMFIDEVDIARIAPGQRVMVTLDAYKDQVFEAEITRIYPLKDERSQTFKIEGRFIKPPKRLYAGLSGEANIVLSERKSSITIPVEYLLQGNKVITESGEISVVTGLKNIDRVEILSGLDTNTKILKP